MVGSLSNFTKNIQIALKKNTILSEVKLFDNLLILGTLPPDTPTNLQEIRCLLKLHLATLRGINYYATFSAVKKYLLNP